MSSPTPRAARATPRAVASDGFVAGPAGNVGPMPPSRDEDLDWLYGRASTPSAPEPTRVMPAPLRGDAGGPSGAGSDGAGTGGRGSGGAGAGGAWPPPSQPSGPTSDPPSGPPTGQPPGPPGAVPRGPRKRRHPVRNTVRVLTVLVLLAALWLVGVPAYAWSHVARVDATPAGQRPGSQPGKTFLLVGSDSREGLTKAQQKKLGTGSVAGQRTDTIMLLYVPPGGKPALISIPRDSYVDIPGHGKNKVNSAYAFGGPELLVKTVEADTGLRVDGYLEIGFGGFVSVIDALDGIRMCLPNAIKDADSHLNL
ncbi:MAG: LytR family regulatory protein [Friedmanniella sp.]|nr:LytR family regulatory protein [Friedmanniella sp.]